MSERISAADAWMAQEDLEGLIDKLEKGMATIEDCEEKAQSLLVSGMLQVKTPFFSKDPRARGAEGRVESQTYNLKDIKDGRVTDTPDNTDSPITIEFTDRHGGKNEARLDYRLGKFFKPQIYNNLEVKPM